MPTSADGHGLRVIVVSVAALLAACVADEPLTPASGPLDLDEAAQLGTTVPCPVKIASFVDAGASGSVKSEESLMRNAIGRRIGYLILVVATVFVFGCGPKHMVIEDPTLNDSNSGHLTIYRPDAYFHKYNPEEPHVYVGDRKIESLGVGERISLRLPAGEHQITVRESMLGISTYTLGTVRLNVETGEEHLIRFVQPQDGTSTLNIVSP